MRTVHTRLLPLALLTASLTGCTLNDPEAPALTGPSTSALAVTVTASPETLIQDGSSTSSITAVARDASGSPVANMQVSWQAVTSDGRVLTPSSSVSLTDGNGRATTVITSPAAPAAMPTSPVTITVTATPVNPPVGTTSMTRQLSLDLVPPAGTPAANNNSVAAFTFAPSTPTINQAITFDASTTTDEGSACGSSCSYRWVFDDGTTGTGVTATKSYNTAATYTVMLTVTDARGGTNSTTNPVTVSASPLTARITFSPTNPRGGGAVTDTVFFDGRGSTSANGATITSYEWDFGNGSSGTGSTASTTYSAARTFTVRLTITDSLGRTATTTTTVTITTT